MMLAHFARIATRSKQTGSTLMWGMAILLVMSIIGVTAARMGIIDTKIVGNEMSSMLTYQGAESQLNLVRPPLDMLAPSNSLAFIKSAMESPAKAFVVPQTNTAVLFQSDKLTTSVQIRHGEFIDQCPPLETSMSLEMNGDKYSCSMFIVDANSRLQGTGARSAHEMGIVHFMPAAPPIN
ncbi:MAG: hypothetical protein E6Q83_05800 [Thiothrix sp.]|nr:MAG: hypothetical protein E6Q83_05800 [Thiothrix sp.]